jgi:hypothetical protein
MTLPALRQEVQTFRRRRWLAPIFARTVWMFGFHRRWVRRCECETDMPKPGPLPQMSHTAATSHTPWVRREDGTPASGRPGKGNPPVRGAAHRDRCESVIFDGG